MVGLLACVILSRLRADTEQFPLHIEQCIISGAAGCIHAQDIYVNNISPSTCHAKYVI